MWLRQAGFRPPIQVLSFNQMPERSPLIAHFIQRMAIGGLENGLINLVNQMPRRYRHAIICLNGSTEFSRRIERADVEIVDAQASLGRHAAGHLAVLRILRRLRPQVVHTRNIGTIEVNIAAAMMGIPARVHGEHGRDSYDPSGLNKTYRRLRRFVSPAIHKFVAVSHELASWLSADVGIQASRVVEICNGVDSTRFSPANPDSTSLRESFGCNSGHFVIGFAGRFEPIKDPLNLILAVISLLHNRPEFRQILRLVMIGEGSLRPKCQAVLEMAGLRDIACLPGSRSDIPDVMRSFDVFVLPSQGEGLSNTILEAMASGLPVVATDVGGNGELVDRRTGLLVPASSPELLADALGRYLDDRTLVRQHGDLARRKAENSFSIDQMVMAYTRLYDSLLGGTS
jgi:sugar transferase (PEP-CTERM/EpsH1 system associated)